MFDLHEYRNREISPKLRCFFEYLDTIFYDTEKFNIEDFELLNEDDFIKALRFYIDKASPARQTAQGYVRDVRSFFEMLYEDYGIRNSVFYDHETSVKFDKMKAAVISELREQENKECISDDELEKLNMDIERFLKTPNLVNLIIKEIESNYSDAKKQPRHFCRFASIIPIKLAMKYGLSNRTLVDLKIQDLDLGNKTLCVRGFSLPLTNEIIELMEMYNRMRRIIVDLSESDLDYLFLKIDGKSFVSERSGVPDYGTFFFFMEKCINTTACKRLCYKRVVELVGKGADVKTLSKLVDITPDKIRSLCNIDNERAKDALISVIMEQHVDAFEQEVVPKGSMKCVYCGKVHNAASSNWVLIQTTDSEQKYLACKECRGKDGKYRY